jgi:DNA polymerase alpha subunit B
LNATSVVIEGSSASSGGARINVDLSQLRSSKTAYSLFPGQVVAIEGMNPTGRKLTANRICEGAAQKPNTTSVKQLREYHYDKQDGAPLKVMTACGPFTTSDSMEYQPIVDLMHEIMEQAPDVVILTGPFVDMRQELVKEGKPTVEFENDVQKIVSYDALFAINISALIDQAFSEEKDLQTQFVLVPSVDDATARWV